MFCHTECKKICVATHVASCFHHRPEGFWMELQHQLWTFCTAQSGHCYIWPLIPPQPREEKPFCWEREDHNASPTRSSQCRIPRAAFPTMDQTYHTVLPWQKSKEVGDHMSRGPIQYSGQTWPSANATVRPLTTSHRNREWAEDAENSQIQKVQQLIIHQKHLTQILKSKYAYLCVWHCTSKHTEWYHSN